jgi:hypothetical protein
MGIELPDSVHPLPPNAYHVLREPCEGYMNFSEAPQCSKKAALASKDGETVRVSENQSLPHVLVTLDHIIIRKHLRTSLLLDPFPLLLCH